MNEEQPSLGFDNFKPLLNRSIFKCSPWLNISFFGGRTSKFSERWSQDLSNGTNTTYSLTNFFSPAHL
jgi:hypothetical protein